MRPVCFHSRWLVTGNKGASSGLGRVRERLREAEISDPGQRERERKASRRRDCRQTEGIDML